jgi:uncharacterized membrane protein required for colicin V production
VEPSAAASGLNPLDLAAVAIVILAFVLGLRSGFFSQLGGLLGAVAGGALVLLTLPLVREQLQSMDPPLRALIVIASFIIAIGIGEALGSAAGVNIRTRLGTGFLGSVDRMTGALLGAAQGLLIIWLASTGCSMHPACRRCSPASSRPRRLRSRPPAARRLEPSPRLRSAAPSRS